MPILGTRGGGDERGDGGGGKEHGGDERAEAASDGGGDGCGGDGHGSSGRRQWRRLTAMAMEMATAARVVAVEIAINSIERCAGVTYKAKQGCSSSSRQGRRAK